LGSTDLPFWGLARYNWIVDAGKNGIGQLRAQSSEWAEKGQVSLSPKWAELSN
jgi:hypothetical protein